VPLEDSVDGPVRFQRALDAAFEKMRTLRLAAGALDEYFWDTMHDCLVEAGATDTDCDVVAAHYVTCIVQWTPIKSEERVRQWELIAHHLAQTDMTVRVGKDDAYISVEFPSRPKVH
jgi:hypothetical protein